MRSRFVYVLAAVIIVVGATYAGWRSVRERQSHSCAACQRPVHEQSRTVAVVDGKKAGYCCLACALSERRQRGSAVNVVSLTDYARGAVIDPARAYLVRGSEVHSCSHITTPMGADKHPLDTHFDRCTPSLLAFSTKEAAQAFALKHGGQALPYDQIAASFR